jgi:hypothetical protein
MRTRLSGLFLSLCTRQHPLLEGLTSAYAAAPPSVREALLAQSGALVRALGAANPSFVQLVRAPPAGRSVVCVNRGVWGGQI